MISPQEEINKRRSKALHLLNSRQIIAEVGAVDDVEQTRREAARPDGFMQPHHDMRFEIVENQGLVAGQFQLLQESKSEIDASGVNPAIEGDLKASSGRAQEMIASAGLAEQAIAFEALRDWSWRIYRATWHRIRQYWTEERWVRVTDDERNLRWIGINTPAKDEMGQPIMGPDGQPQRQNVLGELDIDLILEEGPDTVTIQSEQFEQLVELKKADPQAIPTKAIIEASSLRNKEAILEHLQQGGVPPELTKKMQEMQQALQDTQQQLQKAEQKLSDKGLDADKAEKDRQLAWFEAETARLAVLQKDGHANDALEMKIAQMLQTHEQSAADRMHEAMMLQAQQAHQAEQSQQAALAQPQQGTQQ